MIDKNNNFDEIDNMLFSYFDNNKDIPSSTQDTITNAFNLPAKPISLFYKIQKVAVILIAFVILTTGVVFAKDIIKFISSLFTNTTKGIDKAVEHGYVQNVDMDFVYDNDIGVKVDYLVMDDSNLDVSFVYDFNEKNISSLSIYEYIIRDENNNIIYKFSEDNSKFKDIDMLSKDCIRENTNIHTNKNNLFYESLLFTAKQYPKSSNLIFEISSILINNEKHVGNWLFEIKLDKSISKRETKKYVTTYTPYIENISVNSNKTILTIDMNLNILLDNNILLEPNNIILQNENGTTYDCTFVRSGNILNSTNNIKSTIHLDYDISNFDEKTNSLKLYLKLNENQQITILLKK